MPSSRASRLLRRRPAYRATVSTSSRASRSRASSRLRRPSRPTQRADGDAGAGAGATGAASAAAAEGAVAGGPSPSTPNSRPTTTTTRSRIFGSRLWRRGTHGRLERLLCLVICLPFLDGILQTSVGDAAGLRAPEHLLALPRPTGPVTLATSSHTLAAPLRTLAQRLKPGRICVDQGGAGNCGPNTLVYMLGLVELTEADGVQLRRIVSDHSKADGVLQRTTSILLEDDSLISMEKLIQLNINHWPSHALQGKPRTIETWQELILQPATWTDVAFVQLTADFFRVSFHHIGVDDRSSVFDMGTISPCDGASSVALCEIGVWYDRHFVAILDVAPSAQGAKPDAPPPPPSRNSDVLSSFTFPLVEVSEARRFIASFERVSLVGFEFSGAMRSALEASFDPSVREAALSVDLRPCDIGGPHYQGDGRDVLHLAAWHRAFFFPPCFQQLRGDLDCIENKIADKRAFWGCIRCSTASSAYAH